MLCSRCKKEISGAQKAFLNAETGITYHYHVPDCYDELKSGVITEYVWLMWRIAQRLKLRKEVK